jgi:imidazole glycerol-phosphate synthase subunit HisF
LGDGLAVRIIPTLLIHHGSLVKGRCFDSWRVVGVPVQAARVHNLREVDELLVLDISATREGRGPDYQTIEAIAKVNFVPLTVGGGVKTRDHARALLNSGADKIAIESGGPDAEEAVAALTGCQSVVRVVSGDRLCLDRLDAVGEVIIQCRDRDGTLSGYDLDRLRCAVQRVSVPVVASSGCGSYEHMHLALQVGVDAVAAGALWQFTPATPRQAKEYLAEQGWEVRF